MEKLYIDVRGFSEKKKKRVQDAFFKLGLKWNGGGTHQYLFAGGYTNVYAMNGSAEGNLMFSSGIASEHQRKYEITYTELMRKAGMDESDPDTEREPIEMSDLKLQPGDYTTLEEIEAYAERVDITLKEAYQIIRDALVASGACCYSYNSDNFAFDDFFGWDIRDGRVYGWKGLTVVDEVVFTRHLTPEQILSTHKQEDLQSEKQAEQLALPTRDLQSIINDYLWLLVSLTDEQARDIIKSQLTDLTYLQYKQYAAITSKVINNT